MNKFKLLYHLISNMGWSYLVFRVKYEIRRETGLLKRSFPVDPPVKTYPSLETWKTSTPRFFCFDRIRSNSDKAQKLKARVQRIKAGEIPFFDNLWFNLGTDYDWVTNPQSGFKYSKDQHWTEVSDFSSEQGDIKFVWEKSRFLYLYPVMRFDRYTGEDQGSWVFQQICSWIESNPINCGPNYKCSQEIGLRVLNWLYALYHYRNHPALTQDIFQQLMHHIYWQMHHIYHNIDFSRKAVRNNHTLTEALALCLVGTLLPDLPEADRWKEQGKFWFEEALQYQVFEDGSYLQYSMNYHRVVVQLLTWAILLGKLNDIQWSPVVHQKAAKSLKFLLAFIQPDGQLPNYGANDGALFFPLCSSDFRDYRSQLNALHVALYQESIFDSSGSRETLEWLGFEFVPRKPFQRLKGCIKFTTGGYYGFAEETSFTFIRCGSHPFRPSQADNMHLDLWYLGENIMRDAGSYQYNASPELVQFFSGSGSHNTVMLNDHDQMKKGPRFVWLNWSNALSEEVFETDESYIFEGTIHAFIHLGPNIHHRRKVVKYKGEPRWLIEDEILHQNIFKMTQVWNPGPAFNNSFQVTAVDKNGKRLPPKTNKGWYSDSYGQKEITEQMLFQTQTNQITTEIGPV